MDAELIPLGFLNGVAMAGMVIFLVFGIDLLFGAKLMSLISRTLNRQFHVDETLIRALQELQKTSDRQFDVETSILRGWGRFVMSGLLLFGAFLILINVLPSLR